MRTFFFIFAFLQSVSTTKFREPRIFTLRQENAADNTTGDAQKSDSVVTHTNSVVFLALNPIIYIFDGTDDEATTIKQLESSFKSEFKKTYISLNINGEKIQLMPDKIMIIGSLDALDHIIYYHSVKESMNSSVVCQDCGVRPVHGVWTIR